MAKAVRARAIPTEVMAAKAIKDMANPLLFMHPLLRQDTGLHQAQPMETVVTHMVAVVVIHVLIHVAIHGVILACVVTLVVIHEATLMDTEAAMVAACRIDDEVLHAEPLLVCMFAII